MLVRIWIDVEVEKDMDKDEEVERDMDDVVEGDSGDEGEGDSDDEADEGSDDVRETRRWWGKRTWTERWEKTTQTCDPTHLLVDETVLDRKGAGDVHVAVSRLEQHADWGGAGVSGVAA